jgi:hypothetical protein
MDFLWCICLVKYYFCEVEAFYMFLLYFGRQFIPRFKQNYKCFWKLLTSFCLNLYKLYLIVNLSAPRDFPVVNSNDMRAYELCISFKMCGHERRNTEVWVSDIMNITNEFDQFDTTFSLQKIIFRVFQVVRSVFMVTSNKLIFRHNFADTICHDYCKIDCTSGYVWVIIKEAKNIYS